MNFIENYPQGYWQVENLRFINKYDALVCGTERKCPVRFMYFDSVWKKFDRTLLGKYSLKELYKQRAQQLREKYDYLILYFSGGADSYNALRAFTDNGIKLDEICVKWCTDTLTANTQVYTPNNINSKATNYLSEWDLAIKPVLDWVAQSHPEINIEIVDWFKDKPLIGSEDTFKLVNHWHDVEVPSLAVWSSTENKLIEKGSRVGSIYGVDKPMNYFENGKAYMFFSDSATTMGTPNPHNISGTEYFYWSPDFPILPFEMANVSAKWYLTKPDLLSETAFHTNSKFRTGEQIFRARQIQQSMLRHVLYDTWTDRFQADKPVNPDRSDKHFWIYGSSELARIKDGYRDMATMHVNQVSPAFTYTFNGSSMYLSIQSDKHLLFEYDTNLEHFT